MIPTGCDTLVALGPATTQGQTILAKNSDRPPEECQPLIQHPRRTYAPGSRTHCQFVTLPEAPVTYAHVGSRPYWCWGYEHGFNEHQVVIGNEALPSRLPEAREGKLVGMELIRLGLERGATAAEAVQVMTDLVSRYGQGKFANAAGVRTYDNGYIVADPREAYILETAGHEWAVKRVEGAVGISNIYSLGTNWDQISPTAQTTAAQFDWDPGAARFDFAAAFADPAAAQASGFWRRTRSCALAGRESGTIDARTMMTILSDHGDGRIAHEAFQTTIPTDRPSICMHQNQDGSGGNTAASLVADLCADGSRLPVYWCGFYSPCLALFLPIFTQGELPGILSVGDGQESSESPWWRFRQLSRAVRQSGDSGVALVREGWAPLQLELWQSAYQMAEEAQALLDTGKSEPVHQMLSAYMAESTVRMLSQTDYLLQELTAHPVSE